MELLLQGWVGWLIVTLLGAAFGSFATMASYRLPREENMATKPSRCPSCNTRLGIKALFPVLSWCFQKGKCRYCHTSISLRYPLTELGMIALFLLVYERFGHSPEAFILFGLVICLVIMVVVDFEFQIIPDTIQVGVGILGLLYWYVTEMPFYLLWAGPLVGFGLSMGLRTLFFLWKKKEALGLGDVKFLAVIGWFLGLKAWPVFLMLSGMAGIFTAIVYRLMGHEDERFPFGPSLALALLICLLWPEYTTSMLYP